MFSSDDSPFELTNLFTFVIEIGLGILIAIIVFLYSKQLNDKLENEKKTQREIYLNSVKKCLSDIWKKCTLIILNLDHHNLPEDLRGSKIDEITADVINTNKIQISLALQQLNTLTVLLAPLPLTEPELLTSLLKFQKESMDNVFQTGRLRASQPWSTMIVELDRIVKKFFPTSIEEFSIKELQHILPEEFKKEIMQGRKGNQL